MSDPRPRLVALLTRLDAPDLAAKVWGVHDVGQMLDVIGHHTAERCQDRDGAPNQLGRELDELAEALLDEA